MASWPFCLQLFLLGILLNSGRGTYAHKVGESQAGNLSFNTLKENNMREVLTTVQINSTLDVDIQYQNSVLTSGAVEALSSSRSVVTIPTDPSNNSPHSETGSYTLSKDSPTSVEPLTSGILSGHSTTVENPTARSTVTDEDFKDTARAELEDEEGDCIDGCDVSSDLADEGGNESGNFTREDLVAAARELTLYKIGIQIHYYWLPIIIPIGLLGNLLAFVVLIQPASRRMSCCLYMAALAVSDSVILLDGAYYYISTVLISSYYTMDDDDCMVMTYVLQTAFSMGATLVIAMTVDRYMAVHSPLKAKVTCTPRRAILIICAVVPFCFIYNLPHIYMSGMVDPSTCAAFQTDDISGQFFSWMNFATNCVIPFIVILVLNTGIIITIRSRSRKFQHRASTSTASSIGPSGSSWSSTSRPPYRSLDSGRDAQLSLMLLLVTFVFLLLTLPQYTRYAVYTFLEIYNSPETYAAFIFVYHISNKCYFTNSAVNFLLYCIAGSRFRSDLKTMWRNRTLHLKTASHIRARSVSAESNVSEMSVC